MGISWYNLLKCPFADSLRTTYIKQIALISISNLSITVCHYCLWVKHGCSHTVRSQNPVRTLIYLIIFLYIDPNINIESNFEQQLGCISISNEKTKSCKRMLYTKTKKSWISYKLYFWSLRAKVARQLHTTCQRVPITTEERRRHKKFLNFGRGQENKSQP